MSPAPAIPFGLEWSPIDPFCEWMEAPAILAGTGQDGWCRRSCYRACYLAAGSRPSTRPFAAGSRPRHGRRGPIRQPAYGQPAGAMPRVRSVSGTLLAVLIETSRAALMEEIAGGDADAVPHV